jgi:hypothetical protein
MIMTSNKAQKAAIRQRMAETGEPYVVARNILLGEKHASVGDPPEATLPELGESAEAESVEPRNQADQMRQAADSARDRTERAEAAAERAEERADLAQEAADLAGRAAATSACGTTASALAQTAKDAQVA